MARFRLKPCLVVESGATGDKWYVPEYFVHEDGEGQWLQLRFSCKALVRLVLKQFRPLTGCKAVRLVLDLRAAAVAALEAPSLFEEESRKRKRKAEGSAESVEITLPGPHGGVLRVKVPRRKTEDLWIQSDAIDLFLSWLERADLSEVAETRKYERSGRFVRRAVADDGQEEAPVAEDGQGEAPSQDA